MSTDQRDITRPAKILSPASKFSGCQVTENMIYLNYEDGYPKAGFFVWGY
ncbi:MAG TPA: hypothetical protein VJ964_13995 [Balneolaceae bacterium]|nr:hypothetical protein [Balneolaceae bacterium]